MAYLILLAVLFPGGLLLLAVGMEQLERPLRNDDVRAGIENFFEDATPEELEAYVTEGYGTTVDRFWRRQHRVRSRTSATAAPRYVSRSGAERMA